jgi:hypothetical protein
MDNFQILLVNIFILTLWCAIIPCLSAAIYLFLPKSDQRQNIVGAKKHFTISILLFISILLLLVVGGTTISMQSINPLCARAGDPNQMLCIGRGFLPNSEAIAITNNKTLSDLVHTLGIPVITSFGLAFIVVCIQDWGKAKIEKHTK